jgi:hypothetical protein
MEEKEEQIESIWSLAPGISKAIEMIYINFMFTLTRWTRSMKWRIFGLDNEAKNFEADKELEKRIREERSSNLD